MKSVCVSLIAGMLLAGSVLRLPADTPPKTEVVLNLMSGTADEPKTFLPDSLLVYTLIQKYHETIPDSNKSRVRPIVIRSMGGENILIGRRGAMPDGTVTWDVSGKTVSAPGLYFDTWLFYRTDSPLKGNSEQGVQTIRLPVRKRGDPAPLPNDFVFDGPELQLGITERTEREILSDALLPHILRRLTEPQRKEMEAGQEVTVSIPSLPPLVRRQAIDYVLAVEKERSGSTDSRPLPETREDEYSLVVLPPPSTALGVNSAPAPDGMIQHF
jgi:hypothetical protein